MRSRSITLVIALAGTLLLVPGCASKDQTAATAAAEAEGELQQGDYLAAGRAIRRAIAARDDVSDYWVLAARIDIATKDYAGAFEAYQNLLQLDRANVEALRQLCQLGLAVRQPDKVDQYADQLLLLNPQDPMPMVSKGGAALQRADATTALNFAERVLTVDPHNVGALILKGQVLAYKQDFKGAAQLIEASLDGSNGQTSRLSFLRDLYPKTGNLAGYSNALMRLARENPDDTDMQVSFADLLYQTDRPEDALSVLRRIMVRHPKDIGLATSAVELWLDEGADAMTPEEILSAKNLPLEMRAAFAQFASETGRPDLAVRLLGNDAAAGEPNTDTSDAKAAMAFALGVRGHLREGLAQLQQILDVDPDQPRALLARARLRALSGNAAGALEDARNAVTKDTRNITARLALTDILLAQNQEVLAESNLREALRVRPESVRAAARLADLLTKDGRSEDISGVLTTLARAAPLNPRVRPLLTRYHVPTPPPTAA